jgi:hypothetical protein
VDVSGTLAFMSLKVQNLLKATNRLSYALTGNLMRLHFNRLSCSPGTEYSAQVSILPLGNELVDFDGVINVKYKVISEWWMSRKDPGEG